MNSENGRSTPPDLLNLSSDKMIMLEVEEGETPLERIAKLRLRLHSIFKEDRYAEVTIRMPKELMSLSKLLRLDRFMSINEI